MTLLDRADSKMCVWQDGGLVMCAYSSVTESCKMPPMAAGAGSYAARRNKEILSHTPRKGLRIGLNGEMS